MYKNHPDNFYSWSKRATAGAVAFGLLFGQVSLPIISTTTVAFAEGDGGAVPATTADDPELLAKSIEAFRAEHKTFEAFLDTEAEYLKENEPATIKSAELKTKYQDLEAKIEAGTATIAELDACTQELHTYVDDLHPYVEQQKIKEKKTALQKEVDELQALLTNKYDFFLLSDLAEANQALKKAEDLLKKTSPEPTLDEVSVALNEFQATHTFLKERIVQAETVEVPALKRELPNLLLELKDLFNQVAHNFTPEIIEEFLAEFADIDATVQDPDFSNYMHLSVLKREILEIMDWLNKFPRKAKDVAPAVKKHALPKTGDASMITALYTIGGVSVGTLGLLLKKKSEEK